MTFGDKSDTTLTSFLGRPPDQVGYVVRDFEESVQRYGRIFGISHWFGYEYGFDYLPRRSYRGGPGEWVSKVAVPFYGPSLEIIVANDAPSVFSDFLRGHGPGLHHLGYFIPDLDAAAAGLAAQGYPIVQDGGGHGVDGDGRFAFVDLTREFGSYLELIEPPARRHEPHFRIDFRIDIVPDPEGAA